MTPAEQCATDLLKLPLHRQAAIGSMLIERGKTHQAEIVLKAVIRQLQAIRLQQAAH